MQVKFMEMGMRKVAKISKHRNFLFFCQNVVIIMVLMKLMENKVVSDREC